MSFVSRTDPCLDSPVYPGEVRDFHRSGGSRLRKVWVVLTVTGLLILGCSKTRNLFGAHTPDPASARTPPAADSPSPHDGLAGKCLIFYSWGCGSYSQTTWTLHPDGTFFSPAVNQKGRWSVQETEFELTFPYSPFVTYTGTVDPSGENMEGTMAGNDGSSGCWHAHRE